MPDPGNQSPSEKTAGLAPRGVSSDERLLAAASRNPSLAGRELLIEILARGPEPEAPERPGGTDVRAAFQRRSLDDPAYRTAAEQADWLGKESQELRDLYERGAVIKGETLVIPAEGHELPAENDEPFLTSLAYAHERIPQPEHAAEFHALGRAIAGEMADARGEIETFRFYYDRLKRDQRGQQLRQDQTVERAAAVKRTLAEMRAMADVMRQLETQHSVEVTQHVVSLEQVRNAGRADRDWGFDKAHGVLTDDQHAHAAQEASGVRQEVEDGGYSPAEQFASGEEREVEAVDFGMNTSARKVRLAAESLRLPAGLSFETKERLVAQTLPAIDRKLESGTSRAVIFAAINGQQRKLNEAGQQGAEARDAWFQVGGFIKAYVDERLRDPETRELNRSPAFRAAHAQISAARTPQELSRAAERLLRENSQRSQALQRHCEEPDNYAVPAPPLDARQRQLLFYGRSPEHFSPAMRELKFNWGLSRQEREARVQLLRAGQLESSPALKVMLLELASRSSVRAVAHYQATIINAQVANPGRLNLRSLHESLAPHERDYLFERVQERKRALTRTNDPERNVEEAPRMQAQASATGRAFGQVPVASGAYRDYMASMGVIERQLLNEAVQQRRGAVASELPLSITEARAVLPQEKRLELRLRARQLAWETVAPLEVMGRNPGPAAERLREAIVQVQEQVQEKARVAHTAREQFIQEQVAPAEKRLREDQERAAYRDAFKTRLQELRREAAERMEQTKLAFSNSSERGTEPAAGSFARSGNRESSRAPGEGAEASAKHERWGEKYAEHGLATLEDAHQAGLEAAAVSKQRPLFASPAEQERFTRSVLAQLAPADARKLAELDHYAARTREEVYRGFETIDALRRDVDMSRLPREPGPPQNSLASERAPGAATVAEAHLAETANRSPEASGFASPAPPVELRRESVETDQQWHFERLREVLRPAENHEAEARRELAHEHFEIGHAR